MGPNIRDVPGGAVTLEEVRRAPKVLLHDHLDGGLRPGTLAQLARAAGYNRLPDLAPAHLGEWFVARATGRGLDGYLACFAHTVAVMQTGESLERVAFECAEDLAADGVMYAEVRFAPELHTEGGLSMAGATEAVLGGLSAGASEASLGGRSITVRLLLSAMRHTGRSLEVAKTAAHFQGSGVVGFDLAGPEEGHPASAHLESFRTATAAGLHTTAHAGEAAGPWSVAEVVGVCRVDRVGHGVSVAREIPAGADRSSPTIGPTARVVLDRRIPLEICPTSNVQTGAASSVAEHPLGCLYRLGFGVTVNTDNRLMSGVSLSSELTACARAFGWGSADLRRLSLNSLESAFCEDAQRRELQAKLSRYYACGALEARKTCG